jgi:hypothetical protein
MKKHILYIALASLCMSGFTACNDDDPLEASSKHVYAADEAPYLRTDADAKISVSTPFRAKRISAQTINLKDYAETVQTKLGMTVDDMLAGVQNGSVKFLNINSAKACWVLTEPTSIGNVLGWNYNSAGLMTAGDDLAVIGLDLANKALVVDLDEDAAAGVMFTENVGFALVNGTDYDTYVRFTIDVAVTDPGMVTMSIAIPEGDYASYEIDFNDCEKAIEGNFGMTVSEFNAAVQDPEGDIAMYMIDANDNWITEADYTANGIGYWCKADGTPTTWGSDSEYYVETHDGTVGIGRYPGLASGTVYNVHFVYASKSDDSKFVEFKVVATLD